MQTDSMFRIYSMTKVLTSFLAAKFYEEHARRRIGIDS
jgi:CubicO group peptidase (beta-lactamase class C family)